MQPLLKQEKPEYKSLKAETSFSGRRLLSFQQCVSTLLQHRYAQAVSKLIIAIAGFGEGMSI